MGFFVPLQPYYIGKKDKYTKIRVGKTDELITYMLNKYIDKLIKDHFQIIHMPCFYIITLQKTQLYTIHIYHKHH